MLQASLTVYIVYIVRKMHPCTRTHIHTHEHMYTHMHAHAHTHKGGWKEGETENTNEATFLGFVHRDNYVGRVTEVSGSL